MRTLILFASCWIACAQSRRDPIDVPVDAEPPDGDVLPQDGALVAPFDNDSEQAPALDLFLSPTGTRELLFSEEVSSPLGDERDFVAFELPQDSNPLHNVTITLTCSITGTPTVPPRATVFANGIANVRAILCNEGAAIVTINNTQPQVVRVELTNATQQAHMSYELTVAAF